MSILRINTINKYSAANHQNLSKNFKADDSVSRKFTDEELLEMASYAPDKKMYKVSKNAFKSLLIAVPALDVALTAVTKKGALASKVKSAAIVSTFWTTAFAIMLALGKTKKAVNNRSKLLDDFNKEHPFASTFVDLAAMFAVFKGALVGGNKICNFIKISMPEKVQVMKNKVVNPVKTMLNKSFVNRKAVQPFENYLEKNPVAAKAFKTTALLTVPTVILATFLRYAAEAKKRNENVENNYYILKTINENYVHHVDEEDKV